MTWQVINGNNIDILKTYPDNYFDSIVTDPPYGIEFLGKDWDKNTGPIETWKECLRVLKPGGYLLAFSAARTYHRLATNIEDVGFEIKDQLMWIYSTGFPKAQDVGKMIQKKQGVKEYEGFVDTTKNAGFGMTDHARVRAGVEWSTKAEQVGSPKCTSEEAKKWEGWKTAMKPAHEPIVMARKPMKGTTVDNVLTYGTGALNIDESRVGDEVVTTNYKVNSQGKSFGYEGDVEWEDRGSYENTGRYPSNVIGEIHEYQKYFYQPKVSKNERNVGCDDIEEKQYSHDGREKHIENPYQRQNSVSSNNHPTVKPVELMKYLVRLVTQNGGTVLDPFNGSGSTGMACVELKMNYVGCELDEAYVEIANKRIAAWEEKHSTPFNNLFE